VSDNGPESENGPAPDAAPAPDAGPVYDRIIKKIFQDHYAVGTTNFTFDRPEIEAAALALGVAVPRNVGDLIYSFRHRRPLPDEIRATAPGKHWVIANSGRSIYRFVVRDALEVVPNPLAAVTRIPDATPGIINMHAKGDEQALLARLRYNRLLDIFTGLACYSLQSHLRTTVDGAQIETDEVYVGLNRLGAHYVLPVQAKGGSDHMGIVQIEQDFALCEERFPNLVAKPIGAQFMDEEVIALFAFGQDTTGVVVLDEKHYKLVPPNQITPEELAEYRQLTE
jgi:hypothetical protein